MGDHQFMTLGTHCSEEYCNQLDCKPTHPPPLELSGAKPGQLTKGAWFGCRSFTVQMSVVLSAVLQQPLASTLGP